MCVLTGSKVFVFNYNRPYTKKKNNITLGAYPEISLKQARERHAQARALLAQNIDPVQHREQDNAFKDAFQGAMNEKLGKWLIVQQAHQPSFKLCANVT
ncbi:Arm DNA-binding domain-containing protein [Actinobacillus porcinus]|uniref:Arm DNA-binding domain-containing protein n=1 Tax=Actinobacillus porcinus TaxID=51048 RepID=UPI001083C25C